MNEKKRLEGLLEKGKITRREFIVSMAAMGFSITAAGSMARKVQAVVPKKGGFLKIGTSDGSTSDTLNPATLVAQMPSQISFGQLRDALTVWGADGSAVPELAESWDVTPDAKKWTFKLRKGVEFHNGKPMDVEDVIYSLNYHREEKNKSVIHALFKPVTDVRADGKHAVVITLDSGNVFFPWVLGSSRAQIFPKGSTAADFDKGIGTGPYILEDWEPGVRALVKRNPNYWKESGPNFDAVETLVINDTNSRTNALKTGQIHIMNHADLKTAHLLEKLPNIHLITASGGTNVDMPMRCDTPPFNDPNIRLAIKYSIDRDDMRKQIFHGYAELGNDHCVHSASIYHNNDLSQRQYDPEKARFYLKKAGLSNLKVKLHASDAAFAGAMDAAILSEEYAKKSGIEIEVVQTPADGYWSHTWTKKPWCMSYWGGRPTPDAIYSVRFTSDAPYNDCYWYHDRFDELVVMARKELDEDKRIEMYAETQEILNMEGGPVIPLFMYQVDAASTKIKTPELVGGQFALDYFRAARRWWFKS